MTQLLLSEKNYYKIHFCVMTKREARDRRKNTNLSQKSGQL